MHSPVLIKPIVGRKLVAITISNSSHSRDDPGKYVFEGKPDARTTLLRWQGTVQGHKIESLELLTDNEEGLPVGTQGRVSPVPRPQNLQRQADRVERRKATSRHVGLPCLKTTSPARALPINAI